jgi:hypothetical protein
MSYLRIEERELEAPEFYELAGLGAGRQVTMTCPLVSVTAVVTTHFPSLRHCVSPTFGTFSLSVSSHAPSG